MEVSEWGEIDVNDRTITQGRYSMFQIRAGREAVDHAAYSVGPNWGSSRGIGKSC